jgi:hypothetical protein
MTRAHEKDGRKASLIERSGAFVLGLRNALAAHGAKNIARQRHKLDNKSFEWGDL